MRTDQHIPSVHEHAAEPHFLGEVGHVQPGSFRFGGETVREIAARPGAHLSLTARTPEAASKPVSMIEDLLRSPSPMTCRRAAEAGNAVLEVQMTDLTFTI